MSFGGTDTSTQEERPASGQQLSWGRSAGRSKPIGGRAQLRSACDACHQSKIKCPGGNPCLNCFSGGNRCNYTQASRIGRPKGSKNKPRENKGTLEQRKTDSGNAQLLSQNGNGHATQEHTSPGTARSEEMVMQWVNHGQQQHQKQQQHQGLVLSMDQVHFGSEFAHGFDSMAVPTDIGLPGHGSPSVDSNQDLMEMLDQSLLMENLTNDTSNLVQSMHDAHAQMSMSHVSTKLPTGDQSQDPATTRQGTTHALSVLASPQVATKRDSPYARNSESREAGISKAATTRSPASTPYSTSVNFITAPSTNVGRQSATRPHPITTAFSSSAPLASASSDARSGPCCVCLPRLIKLICQLENLRHITKNSVDPLLHGLQLAETSWKDLVQCNSSAATQQTPPGQKEINDSNHKQALLLFATTIRILLSFVQKFNLAANQQFDASPAEDQSQSDPGNGIAEEVDVSVSVGGIELKGEAKTEIIEVLVQRALRVITSALVHLWEQTRRPSTTAHLPGFPFPTTATGKGGTRPDGAKVANMPQVFVGSASASTTGQVTPSSSRGEYSESISSLLHTLGHTMKVLEEP